MTDTLQTQIIAEVRAILAEDRFGKFSHPVTLGLLLAIDLTSITELPSPDIVAAVNQDLL